MTIRTFTLRSAPRAATIALVLSACTSEPEPSLAEQATADSIAAARTDSIERAQQDSVNRAQPGYVVDSARSVEEDIRRFRAMISDTATRLQGGASSREALIRSFIDALGRKDTVALNRMLLTDAEFGYLVYPDSPNARPPYRQAPELVWMQMRMVSNVGMHRLVQRLGGQQLTYFSHACFKPEERQGKNIFWAQCTLNVSDATGNSPTARLFGSIIQRDGHFKFVSYTNEL